MPSLTNPSSTNFHIRPLPAEISKKSTIGAEVLFNEHTSIYPRLVTLESLLPDDIGLFRQALYDYSVLVVRDQKGIDPNVLPQLAGLWDVKIESTHSGGAKAVKDSRNLLAKNKAERIPRANQVTILGEGCYHGYEGIEKLELHHVVRTRHSPLLASRRFNERLLPGRITQSSTKCRCRRQESQMERLDSTAGIWMPLCMKNFPER